MHRRSLFVVGLLALLITVLLVSATPQASAAGRKIRVPRPEPADGVVTMAASPAEQAATLSMWTREAVAAAAPLPLPQAAIDESGREPILGAPAFVPGGFADPAADEEARVAFAEDWLSTAVASSEFPEAVEGTSGVYTGYYANYYSQMHLYHPYKAVGKLTFRLPSGSSASCTASVISPKNVIVTAAHCVFDTVSNRWNTNFAFTPAYRNGAAPYGVFPYQNAKVLTAHVNATSLQPRYDVAIILLGNNSSGRPVTYYTGYLGRSWNYGYTQSIHTIGYPANISSGLYSYICAAETASGGTDVLKMGCNMTNGSSGGPWLLRYAPYAGGSVNAVVTGYAGSNTFNGPRFSDYNIVPLCNSSPFTC